jgi:hypothetical protein
MVYGIVLLALLLGGCGAKSGLASPDAVFGGERDDAAPEGDAPEDDDVSEAEEPPSTWILTTAVEGGDRTWSAVRSGGQGWFVAGTALSNDSWGDVWTIHLDHAGNILQQKIHGGPNYDWVGGPQAVAKTGEGFLVAGGSDSRDEHGDLWVAKLDGEGNVQWQEIIGGEYSDTGAAVAACEDGDAIVAGWTDRDGTGVTDGWVLRLEEDGGVRWQKILGGERIDTLRGAPACRDDGIVLVGETSSASSGSQDVWIVKLDSGGNVIWQEAVGGGGSDWVTSAADTGDGGCVAAGGTESFGAGSMDVWILRIDADGNILWQKSYGGEANDYAYAVFDAGDGFVVAGETFSFGVDFSDMLAIKVDMDGRLQWQRTINGYAHDGAGAVTGSDDGGILIAGYSSGDYALPYDLMIVKLDGGGGFSGRCDLLNDAPGAALDSSASVEASAMTPRDAHAAVYESGASSSVTSATAVFLCPE